MQSSNEQGIIVCSDALWQSFAAILKPHFVRLTPEQCGEHLVFKDGVSNSEHIFCAAVRDEANPPAAKRPRTSQSNPNLPDEVLARQLWLLRPA